MSLVLNSKEIDHILKRLKVTDKIAKETKIYYSDVYYPLRVFCERINVSAVNFLIGKGADLNSDGLHHRRSLWWAVWNQNEQIVQSLVNKNCEINFVDKETGLTPLDLAVSYGNYRICQLLLSAGATYYPHNLLYCFVENYLSINDDKFKNSNYRKQNNLPNIDIIACCEDTENIKDSDDQNNSVKIDLTISSDTKTVCVSEDSCEFELCKRDGIPLIVLLNKMKCIFQPTCKIRNNYSQPKISWRHGFLSNQYTVINSNKSNKMHFCCCIAFLL